MLLLLMEPQSHSLNSVKHGRKLSLGYLGDVMRDQNILKEVKETLALLAEKSPGRAIEVRIPPYAAIQCGAGPTHTRGTPANVIEMDAQTWLDLAYGKSTWIEAMNTGAILASGARADLTELLPLRIAP